MSGRVKVWMGKVESKREKKTGQRMVRVDCQVRVCAESVAALPVEVSEALGKLLSPEARAVDAMALADGLVVQPFAVWDGELVQSPAYECESVVLERLKLRREQRGSWQDLLRRVEEHGRHGVVWLEFALKLQGDAAQEALGLRGGGCTVWMCLRPRRQGGSQISTAAGQ